MDAASPRLRSAVALRVEATVARVEQKVSNHWVVC
jgi:hypothetical protein